MTDLLKALPFAAKAVAAVVAPIIFTALTWAADNVLPFDVPTLGVIETAVAGAISGIAAYFARNRAKPALSEWAAEEIRQTINTINTPKES
jgi:hypothetical protein